eukprot:415414-Prorocentrum_minimum.AAC.8
MGGYSSNSAPKSSAKASSDPSVSKGVRPNHPMPGVPGVLPTNVLGLRPMGEAAGVPAADSPPGGGAQLAGATLWRRHPAATWHVHRTVYDVVTLFRDGSARTGGAFALGLDADTVKWSVKLLPSHFVTREFDSPADSLRTPVYVPGEPARRLSYTFHWLTVVDATWRSASPPSPRPPGESSHPHSPHSSPPHSPLSLPDGAGEAAARVAGVGAWAGAVGDATWGADDIGDQMPTPGGVGLAPREFSSGEFPSTGERKESTAELAGRSAAGGVTSLGELGDVGSLGAVRSTVRSSSSLVVATSIPRLKWKRSVATPGESTPSAGDSIPSAGDSIPSAGESTPSAGESNPSAGESTPSAGESTPSAGDSTPSAGESNPPAATPALR